MKFNHLYFKPARPTNPNSGASFIRTTYAKSGRSNLSKANVRVHGPYGSGDRDNYVGKAGNFLLSDMSLANINKKRSYYNSRNNTFTLYLRRKYSK